MNSPFKRRNFVRAHVLPQMSVEKRRKNGAKTGQKTALKRPENGGLTQKR